MNFHVLSVADREFCVYDEFFKIVHSFFRFSFHACYDAHTNEDPSIASDLREICDNGNQCGMKLTFNNEGRIYVYFEKRLQSKVFILICNLLKS